MPRYLANRAFSSARPPLEIPTQRRAALEGAGNPRGPVRGSGELLDVAVQTSRDAGWLGAPLLLEAIRSSVSRFVRGLTASAFQVQRRAGKSARRRASRPRCASATKPTSLLRTVWWAWPRRSQPSPIDGET